MSIKMAESDKFIQKICDEVAKTQETVSEAYTKVDNAFTEIREKSDAHYDKVSEAIGKIFDYGQMRISPREQKLINAAKDSCWCGGGLPPGALCKLCVALKGYEPELKDAS